MTTIQPLARTTDWSKISNVSLPDVLAKQATLQTAGTPGPVAKEPEGNEPSGNGPDALRKVFDDFVGQTFYGQMLSAMRKTVDKPAYFHGGHAEEVFQAQLDQTLSERLADSTAKQFTGPMFELFNLARQ